MTGGHRLLCGLAACLLLAGCSTFGSPGRSSLHPDAASSRSYGKAAKSKKQESWLGSWFGPKEPPPPKSVRDWMRQNKQMRLPGQVESR